MKEREADEKSCSCSAALPHAGADWTGSLDRARHLGVRSTRYRSISRSFAAACGDHHPESRVVRRGDGAAGHSAAGDGTEWHATSGLRALYQHLWIERRKVVFRLQQRLFLRSPGSAQPFTDRHSSESASAPAFTLVADWGN